MKLKRALQVLSNPLVVCAIGAAIIGYGESMGVRDGKPGGTISEWFKALPLWVKLFIFFIIGAVCCHLAEWRINDVVIQADNIENVNVQKAEDIEPK